MLDPARIENVVRGTVERHPFRDRKTPVGADRLPRGSSHLKTGSG
jgi:hypothetical protein